MKDALFELAREKMVSPSLRIRNETFFSDLMQKSGESTFWVASLLKLYSHDGKISDEDEQDIMGAAATLYAGELMPHLFGCYSRFCTFSICSYGGFSTFPFFTPLFEKFCRQPLCWIYLCWPCCITQMSIARLRRRLTASLGMKGCPNFRTVILCHILKRSLLRYIGTCLEFLTYQSVLTLKLYSGGIRPSH